MPQDEHKILCPNDAASFATVIGSLGHSRVAKPVINEVHRVMLSLGFSVEYLPSPEALVYTTILVAIAIASYKFQSRRRKLLAKELAAARAQLQYLQEKLQEDPREKKKEIKIFIDGAFDMLHFGHMNAFRLARSLGTHLVVGVNSDSSIKQCKGAPLMNDEERLSMVAACKFVDTVVPDCPYIMSKEYLVHVIEKYNIDYVVHGSDPCIVDGKDVYATAKQAGKFKTIPRTEGVSTTDIVGRMLLLNKEHHCYNQKLEEEDSPDEERSDTAKGVDQVEQPPSHSKFLITSRMLQLFSAGVKAPTRDMRVVYVDGTWDLFHPGHVAFLKEARQRGDYLLVGIHGDALVNRMRGGNLPLMNLHERVLSVLGCKYVSDVLIDAPYTITQDMIDSLNIAEVLRGSRSDALGEPEDENARYSHAIAVGIYKVIPSPSVFNIRNIIGRIHQNEQLFQDRFKRKTEVENRQLRSQRESNKK